MKNSKSQGGNNDLQISCFYLGKAMCGIDINLVQEINKQLNFTIVPHAPEYVLGIMNLRGKIVTIIDLGKKLGLSETQFTDSTRIIIIESQEEYLGLLVDQVTDVVTTDWDHVSSPPSNIKGLKGRFFQGVYQSKTKLIAILDISEVLGNE